VLAPPVGFWFFLEWEQGRLNFGIDPELCNFVALVMKFEQRSLVEKKKERSQRCSNM
jgi:hypothetical protein